MPGARTLPRAPGEAEPQARVRAALLAAAQPSGGTRARAADVWEGCFWLLRSGKFMNNNEVTVIFNKS